MPDTIKVDARGELCPIPVVKAKKALDQAAAGAVVEVHVDNDIAVQNLMKMAKSQGCAAASEEIAKKHFIVRINVGKAGAAGPQPGAAQTAPAGSYKSGIIAVISSAVMGGGDEALGKILMKGFLYALSQLDELPEKVIFYNSGVFLTTEGSTSLADLKAMEQQGVEITSCGTCLDFYGLKEQLAVGEVSNMYQIAEAMGAADKVIRP